MLHATLAGGLLASLLTTSAPNTDRVSEPSWFGPEPVKSVVVRCPDNRLPIAGGGAVEYGPGQPGGVALTGILPDLEQRTVTVTATARPGRPGGWAVTAYAVCGWYSTEDTVTRQGYGSVTAECPQYQWMFGLGFRTSGAGVTHVGIDEQVQRVRVTGAAGDRVTAVAYCGESYGSRRGTATSTAPGWPKVATARDEDPDLTAFATGAMVTGPPTAAIDAIVPGPDGGTSWARGTLLAPPGARTAAKAPEDDSVTVIVSSNATSY